MALHILPDLNAYEAAVDDVIASCDGDLRGALTALIIANEYLERDLQEALASAVSPSMPTTECVNAVVPACDVQMEPPATPSLKESPLPLHLYSGTVSTSTLVGDC